MADYIRHDEFTLVTRLETGDFFLGYSSLSKDPIRFTVTTLFGNIPAGAINTDDIAVHAITTLRIKPLAITTELLNDVAVTTIKIADLNVTTDKLANLSVTTAKLGSLSVTTAKIAGLAVTEAKIGALAVTEGKIGDLAVSTRTIADLSVTNGKIAPLAVTNDKIANATIEEAKHSAAAISQLKHYDYVVDTQAKLDALKSSTSYRRVLIKPPAGSTTATYNITTSALLLYSKEVDVSSGVVLEVAYTGSIWTAIQASNAVIRGMQLNVVGYHSGSNSWNVDIISGGSFYNCKVYNGTRGTTSSETLLSYATSSSAYAARTNNASFMAVFSGSRLHDCEVTLGVRFQISSSYVTNSVGYTAMYNCERISNNYFHICAGNATSVSSYTIFSAAGIACKQISNNWTYISSSTYRCDVVVWFNCYNIVNEIIQQSSYTSSSDLTTPVWTSTAGNFKAFDVCEAISNCNINLGRRGLASAYTGAFIDRSATVNNCRSEYLSDSSTAVVGIRSSIGVTGCRMSSQFTTKYQTSYASGSAVSTYACADTPNGGFNSSITPTPGSI